MADVACEECLWSRAHAQPFPLGGEGARAGAFLFQVTGTSGLLHGSSGSLGIWGLDAGAPIFHLELEPHPSAQTRELGIGNTGKSWARQKLDTGLKEIPLFFFFIIRVFGLAQPSQLSQKFFIFFPSGLVRA